MSEMSSPATDVVYADGSVNKVCNTIGAQWSLSPAKNNTGVDFLTSYTRGFSGVDRDGGQIDVALLDEIFRNPTAVVTVPVVASSSGIAVAYETRQMNTEGIGNLASTAVTLEVRVNYSVLDGILCE